VQSRIQQNGNGGDPENHPRLRKITCLSQGIPPPFSSCRPVIDPRYVKRSPSPAIQEQSYRAIDHWAGRSRLRRPKWPTTPRPTLAGHWVF
jgi:hypothetical protein